MFLSIVALACSVASLTWAVLHDPLGRGMSAYDFTTPENALRSGLECSINGDIRAGIELQQTVSMKRDAEQLRTLKIHKEANYRGTKILFISYEQDGIPRHGISSYEKDADSGLWFETYLSEYSIDDDALEQVIKEWKKQAPGGTQP
ncbi:MAG: hypothetical protein PVJ57_17465 [Phycisphaerae bacterium]